MTDALAIAKQGAVSCPSYEVVLTFPGYQCTSAYLCVQISSTCPFTMSSFPVLEIVPPHVKLYSPPFFTFYFEMELKLLSCQARSKLTGCLPEPFGVLGL